MVIHNVPMTSLSVYLFAVPLPVNVVTH